MTADQSVTKQMLENEFGSSIKVKIDDLNSRLNLLYKQYNLNQKKERLAEIQAETELPDNWSNIEKMRQFEQEKKQIEQTLNPIISSQKLLLELKELFDLIEKDDPSLKRSLIEEIQTIELEVEKVEFLRMFSKKMDSNHAYLDIQAGSGGTEAQDWAKMLMRMYLRFCEIQGFKTSIIEASQGEVAGIKSCTIYVEGPYSFGWLRTETGVHRLVRKSPFDSGNRRHTSFASVFVSPEIDDTVEIDLNPSDLRIDTYRASGAGGQHVNKTDSAVRITHLPTNTVAQSQSSRSQHQNKDQAIKQLRAKLYEQAMLEKTQQQQQLEQEKSDITWGYQIRSYVLDQSRIKDLRTQMETSNVQSVLDGDLNAFIRASLKQQV